MGRAGRKNPQGDKTKTWGVDTAYSPRRGRYGRVDHVATGVLLEVLGGKLVIEGMPISVDLRLDFVDAIPSIDYAREF